MSRRKLTRYEKQINRSRQRFTTDTANHQMTVLHDDGLYRHLRCAQPGPHSWHGWFEVVTWPGSLAIRGDFGDGLVFSRTTDMFAFFRTGSRYGINPDYWAEKLAGGRRSVKEYDESTLREYVFGHLRDCTQQAKEEDDGDLRKAVRKAHELIRDADADGLLGHEAGARDLLSELERLDLVSDTWEWDLTEYPWSFLWACHAITWAIGRYDARRGGAR